MLDRREATVGNVLGAVHAGYPLTATFSLPQIRRPFAGFVDSLQREIAERFGDEFAFRARPSRNFFYSDDALGELGLTRFRGHFPTDEDELWIPLVAKPPRGGRRQHPAAACVD